LSAKLNGKGSKLPQKEDCFFPSHKDIRKDVLKILLAIDDHFVKNTSKDKLLEDDELQLL
jgi:Zn-finger protein